MSINIVLIHKPKGEALGFKVPNTVREQIIEIVDFLESLDFKLTAFRVIENEAVKVEYTNDTGTLTQQFVMAPNQLVYKANGWPVCCSKSTWESKGFYFDDSDEMFERVEVVEALNVQEYDPVLAFRGILEWCRGSGFGLDNFGMRGNGTYSITVDGEESEEFGRGDYVFQNEQGHFEVWTKENLKSEGYTFQDNRPF